jgi:hypothetical protein
MSPVSPCVVFSRLQPIGCNKHGPGADNLNTVTQQAMYLNVRDETSEIRTLAHLDAASGLALLAMVRGVPVLIAPSTLRGRLGQ